MSEELKVCPFCGKEAVKRFGYDIHKVGCSNVNCDIYEIAKYPEDWNTRATDAELAAKTDIIESLNAENAKLEAEKAELKQILTDQLAVLVGHKRLMIYPLSLDVDIKNLEQKMEIVK